jgi:hypothetical protein
MKYLIILALVLGGAGLANAQRIILDLPTKAGELTLFPEVGEPNNFYFVSDKAQLAVDDNGSPRFSFLRYVTNTKSEVGQPDNAQGEGGGIVHAVVSLAVSEEQLDEARRELRRIKPEGEIIGPVIFKSGTFGLVTSFADANGELGSKVVGLGQAPILDGQQAAISMHLTRLGATLLWNSFQTSTPDISFSFMMTMDGYRLPKEAVIEANFEDLYESMEFGLKAGVGGTVTGVATKGTATAVAEAPVYFGAELKAQFEKLHRDGAIKITQIGSDEGMDKLLELAYTKLADVMFDRVEAQSSDQMSPQQMMGMARGGGAGQSQQSAPPVSGVTFSFEMKKKRRTGTFRLDLNKWTTDELVMRFDENIGNLSRFKGNQQHFHQINTDDDLYRQRNIYPILDGYNAKDFGEYINSVTVRLKKDHGNGVTTDKDIRIDRENFSQSGNAFALVYGWNGEKSRKDWMSYEYEVLWSFFGDVEHHEPMQTATFSTINLAAPYRKKEIEFQADFDLLKEQEIRMVSIDVYYEIGGKEFTKQVILNPSRDRLSERTEYLTGMEDQGYEYQITWRLRGNRSIKSERQRATDGLMFVDELPEVVTED